MRPIAARSDDPPYISFIDTDGPNRLHVVKQIAFPEASAGIEQCQFDPNTQHFYLNLPEDSKAGTRGAVVILSPVTLTELDRVHIEVDNCVHPQGMAIEPDDAVLLCVHFQPKSERREESSRRSAERTHD